MSSSHRFPALDSSSVQEDTPTSGPSGSVSPSAGHQASGKHVRVVLPRVSEDEIASMDGEQNLSSGDVLAISSDGHADIAGLSEDASKPEPHSTLEPTMSNEELRSQIARIFSSQNSSPSTPHSGDLSHNVSPPPDRVSQQVQLQGPKSALRKGHVTPGGTEIELGPANEDEARASRRKTEAAEKAHKKAHWWSRSVDTSPEPPVARRKPKPARYSLFHSGDALRHENPGHVTPTSDYDHFAYVPRPDRYRVSGLSALTLLEKFRASRHNSVDNSDESGISTPDIHTKSLPSSPGRSPVPSRRTSMSHISGLVQASSQLGGHGYGDLGKARRPGLPTSYVGGGTGSSSNLFDTISKFSRPFKTRTDEEIRIKNHVQQTASRQLYLLKLCRALMQYGAPTHRLEQYMTMSARVLETEAQFLYIPGCMIISFDDSRSHTADVKLVKVAQGVDLGKIRDTHVVYKDVVHDYIGVEEAKERLDEIFQRKDKFNKWFRVFMYGIASVGVGPFAFEARLIDLPIAFVLGCILGFLQIIVAPSSELYSNVFEIVSVIVTSFLARAFGSIYHGPNGDRLFCYSALAQSSIALILPGYIVLCGSLELQSRSIIAGSVRLVYAIIYSLFIGYGLTLGTAIYGAIDSSATSETSCTNPLSANGYWFFFFVPLFTFCLMVVNQAKWKQMPVMTLIAFSGYMVSYFSSTQFRGNSQVTSTLSALTIGILANIYSRVGMRIDSLLDKPVNAIRARFRKVADKVLPTSSASSSSSSLEKQVDVDEVASKSSTLPHRISGFLHRRQKRDSTTAAGAQAEGTDDKGKAKKRDKSRPNYSLASAAMLPAIFVLVPSGLGVSGSLVQGLDDANALTRNQNSSSITSSSSVITGGAGSGLAFNVSYSVVQVAIGITVGLFLGSLIVYPFGKGGKVGQGRAMRSGLFSF